MAALLLSGPAATSAATPDEIQAAIDRGRAYLFAQQAHGNWEQVQAINAKDDAKWSVDNAQYGGLTALVSFALLASGTSADDLRIKSAVDFLRARDMRGTYAMGVRSQVWNLIPQQPWLRPQLHADVSRTESAMHTRGPGFGFYGYGANSPADDFDHSVSQFAVLGMWSLEQAGAEVPSNYWRVVDSAWHRQQLPDGSWSYYAEPAPADGDPLKAAPSLSMTAAGVATLFITQEYTQLAPRCNGNVDDPAIDRGIAWIGSHLGSVPKDREYYTLFGISRVGLASGYKYLGTTDWYDWGAEKLVREQLPDGYWAGPRDNFKLEVDTAFAVLFLSRGRYPVMMNKLRWGDPGPAGTWNQRPRDVANLSRWVGRASESPLNWQVVDLTERPADLHDAPILYMAGARAPKLSQAELTTLRAYLEDGGLLLGHADCGSAAFANGFRELGKQLFPGRRFRPLEADSPIYTDQTFPATAWKTGRPTVEALSNGDRELMVLLPAGDPAKQWQGRSFLPVRKDAVGQFIIDLFMYAVDKEGLRRRGETYLIDRRPGAPVAPPVRVARLTGSTNADPEPGGWRRLANVMHNAGTAELEVVPVEPAKLDASFALADLTVAAADAKLTDADADAVRRYVAAGGTLLVDVAGGRSLYRSAAEAELARLFPDAPRPLAVLSPDAALYGGRPITVDYRRFNRPDGSLHRPQLRGLTVGGRTAVFYSPEDLAVGMVGMPIGGVAGYVPADATRLVADVVTYANAKAPKQHP